MAQLDKLVLTPLSALQALFPGPQKLIQKRYDKLLDYNSCLQRSTGEELDLAKKEYEALNAQLVEELQVFNRAAKKIVLNCLYFFITLLRNIMSAALQSHSAVVVPVPVSTIETDATLPLLVFFLSVWFRYGYVVDTPGSYTDCVCSAEHSQVWDFLFSLQAQQRLSSEPNFW